MNYLWKPLAETVFLFLPNMCGQQELFALAMSGNESRQLLTYITGLATLIDCITFFLLYLDIAVLALSDSALVLPIFAEPLTVVSSKVSNSKPALYINYQSLQKNLRIIKSERIWGNRPDRGTHVQRQPVSRQSKFVARMATLRMASGKDGENCRFLFYYLLPPPLLPTVNVNISKVVEVKRANLYSCNDMTLRFLNVVFSFRFTVLF